MTYAEFQQMCRQRLRLGATAWPEQTVRRPDPPPKPEYLRSRRARPAGSTAAHARLV